MKRKRRAEKKEQREAEGETCFYGSEEPEEEEEGSGFSEDKPKNIRGGRALPKLKMVVEQARARQVLSESESHLKLLSDLFSSCLLCCV